jgi:hypothetical protein
MSVSSHASRSSESELEGTGAPLQSINVDLDSTIGEIVDNVVNSIAQRNTNTIAQCNTNENIGSQRHEKTDVDKCPFDKEITVNDFVSFCRRYVFVKGMFLSKVCFRRCRMFFPFVALHASVDL